MTLSHPHGQIYGYPFVTPRTRRMLASAARYRPRTGRNLFADVARRAEVAARRADRRPQRALDGLRPVRGPVAARGPPLPEPAGARLPSLSPTPSAAISAASTSRCCGRLEAVHGDALPYISAWHQAPVRVDRDLAYLHLEISSIRRAPGKLKYLAGSESAMGAFVNDVAPEAVARALRSSLYPGSERTVTATRPSTSPPAPRQTRTVGAGRAEKRVRQGRRQAPRRPPRTMAQPPKPAPVRRAPLAPRALAASTTASSSGQETSIVVAE